MFFIVFCSTEKKVRMHGTGIIVGIVLEFRKKHLTKICYFRTASSHAYATVRTLAYLKMDGVFVFSFHIIDMFGNICHR